MAPLAVLFLLLRREPFAAPVFRAPRLLILAAMRALDAVRLPRIAFGRPAFAVALLLARPLIALERPAAAFGRPALLRAPFAFVRPELAFAPRAALPALADLGADATRRLRRRPAPARLRPLPSMLSPSTGGVTIGSSSPLFDISPRAMLVSFNHREQWKHLKRDGSSEKLGGEANR
jgi:hypothetical protein